MYVSTFLVFAYLCSAWGFWDEACIVSQFCAALTEHPRLSFINNRSLLVTAVEAWSSNLLASLVSVSKVMPYFFVPHRREMCLHMTEGKRKITHSHKPFFIALAYNNVDSFMSAGSPNLTPPKRFYSPRPSHWRNEFGRHIQTTACD